MKKNREDTELTTFQKFKILYENIPGVQGLVKLGGYFAFFILMFGLLVVLTMFSSSNKNTDEKKDFNYQEVLEKILDHSNYSASVTINDNKYIVTGEYGNDILTGTIENSTGLTKYKIKDGNIYEIKMDEEISNESLFGEVNYKILLNDKLVNIIKVAAGIKMDGETIIYKYENVNIDDVIYKIDLTITNNKINNIKVYNDTCTYDINYS